MQCPKVGKGHVLPLLLLVRRPAQLGQPVGLGLLRTCPTLAQKASSPSKALSHGQTTRVGHPVSDLLASHQPLSWSLSVVVSLLYVPLPIKQSPDIPRPWTSLQTCLHPSELSPRCSVYERNVTCVHMCFMTC